MFEIFRIGSNIIACGENEEFSDVPQCVDKDECPDARSCVCDLKSTTYENMPGSHHCKCRDGFKSNLECRPTLDLGLSDQQNIPNDAIMVSGEEEGYPKERIRLNSDLGWFLKLLYYYCRFIPFIVLYLLQFYWLNL